MADKTGDAATHYVVELRQGDQRHYVLCERVLVVDGQDGAAGIPRDVLDRMFESEPLRAVPLPTADGSRESWLARGVWPQSGTNVSININSPHDTKE